MGIVEIRRPFLSDIFRQNLDVHPCLPVIRPLFT
jgi:hypothetical protein